MTYCLNCGCKSHCGVECKKDARNGRGKFLGEAVCKHCRCKLCDDRNEPWPTSGRSRQELPQQFLEICKNCRCELCEGD